METHIDQRNLDVLEKIREVDPPSFLFTRITQKIEADRKNKFSPVLTWTLSISFSLIFLINIVMVIRINHQKSDQNNLSELMHLMPENNLYK
jgi:hypothetical protein